MATRTQSRSGRNFGRRMSPTQKRRTSSRYDDRDNENEFSFSQGEGRGRGRGGFDSMDEDDERSMSSRDGRFSQGRYGSSEYNEYEDDNRSLGYRSRGRGEDYFDDEDENDDNRRYEASGDYDDEYYGRDERDRDEDDDEHSSSRHGRSQTRRGSSSRRGFAAMSPQRRRQISSMGGRASHSGSRGRH